MGTTGTKEYRRGMAAIHERVARTGEVEIVTKDGEPYVKIVPAGADATLERLAADGRVRLPAGPRRPVQPVDAGGDDTTAIVAQARR